MKKTITWRKWDDEKPLGSFVDILIIKEGEIWLAQHCDGKLYFDDGKILDVEEWKPEYWCLNTDLHPRRQYNSVQEFFEEPVPQHIEEEVNCQAKIIDTAIDFAEWLSYNTSLEEVGKFYQNGEHLSVVKLFQMYCNELENTQNDKTRG
jgi:hypothetical protein